MTLLEIFSYRDVHAKICDELPDCFLWDYLQILRFVLPKVFFFRFYIINFLLSMAL